MINKSKNNNKIIINKYRRKNKNNKKIKNNKYLLNRFKMINKIKNKYNRMDSKNKL